MNENAYLGSKGVLYIYTVPGLKLLKTSLAHKDFFITKIIMIRNNLFATTSTDGSINIWTMLISELSVN